LAAARAAVEMPFVKRLFWSSRPIPPAHIPQKALVQLAEADAFRPTLGLARREALWAIKALRDEPLPLFAAAGRAPARNMTKKVVFFHLVAEHKQIANL
jgi:hypothetical protein